MDKPNNVIDLKSRRPKAATIKVTSHETAPVVDMTERRNEMLTEERRKVRRTILTEFVAAHVVVPEHGLKRIALYDVSDGGLAFDMDIEAGSFKAGEEVNLRIYLNQQTYFPFVVKVSHAREVSEEGVTRHGCGFRKGTVNDVALHHFIKFIETVSATLRTDSGDVMVSGLRR